MPRGAHVVQLLPFGVSSAMGTHYGALARAAQLTAFTHNERANSADFDRRWRRSAGAWARGLDTHRKQEACEADSECQRRSATLNVTLSINAFLPLLERALDSWLARCVLRPTLAVAD